MGARQTVDGRSSRKRRGDYPTPEALVDLVVEHTLPTDVSGRRVRVLDPACGDGRFLVAAASRLRAAGARPELVGVDVHPDAAATAVANLAAAGFADSATVEIGDALTKDWGEPPFDVVVGNPPYLSPLTATTVTVAGGPAGPYGDVAVAFMDLARRLVRADGGRIGLVLPQSVLSSRDAGAVRRAFDASAELVWSWWSPARHFDADVIVCLLVFETGRPGADRPWSRVVTDSLGIPPLPPLTTAGTLGDHVRATANFRDQYYALVGAVEEGGAGPPLVTSGLIDPGRNRWGERAMRLGGQRFLRPTVVLDRLSPPMRRWAEALLVPKVLVANQTRVIEAVADPGGGWIPGVPVITLRPHGAGPSVDEIAAVLTSPVASCWAWHRAAGTGRSATSLRLGPRWLVDLPWPEGSLEAAATSWRAGDIAASAQAVDDAYGAGDRLRAWWLALLPAGG